LFTFLHAADIHLDSPLVGLERHGDAPAEELRGASRRAFRNLVDLAVEEHVACVLLAGDLYDGDWKDYNTGLFFAQQMALLKDERIPVYIVAGNHDAANQFTKSLRTPENVTRFSTARAETALLDTCDLAIHGRGFATRAVDEDLSASYPPYAPGRFNVGLLHTSLNGRDGHAPYAPCSLDGLRSKHYQYWALGHVHMREEVCRDPWVVFPGNIQGRHVRETGPKGCTLVTVNDGEVTDVRDRRLDVLRWSRCPVDLSGAATRDEVLDRVGRALEHEMSTSDGRLLALRLDLRGDTRAHAACAAHPEHFEQEIRALALDRCGERAWIENVGISTRSEGKAGRDADANDALAGLLGTLGDIRGDDDLIGELIKEFTDLRGKLPIELLGPESPEPMDPTSPATLRIIVGQARELLLARLTSDAR
jgi:DNA repair protein SbcD/Mre11